MQAIHSRGSVRGLRTKPLSCQNAMHRKNVHVYGYDLCCTSQLMHTCHLPARSRIRSRMRLRRFVMSRRCLRLVLSSRLSSPPSSFSSSSSSSSLRPQIQFVSPFNGSVSVPLQDENGYDIGRVDVPDKFIYTHELATAGLFENQSLESLKVSFIAENKALL